MNVSRILTFIVIVIFTVTSKAQVTNIDVTNGAFVNGPNGWSWSQWFREESLGAPDCISNMAPFQPIWDDVTPIDPFRSSMGRSARTAWATTGFDAGRWLSCRRIEQSLQVPLGAVLKLDGRKSPHGLPTATTTTTTRVNVTALDLDSGVEIPLATFTPNSFCGTFDCENFKTVQVDLSKVWGRKVSLRFTTTFSSTRLIGRTIAFGDQVLIDNIRVEKIPISTGSRPTAGQWFNPARSGHGLHLSRSPSGDLLVLWYTYLPSGKSIWYISDVKPMVSGVFTSPIYKSTWNSATGQNTLVAIGDIRLEMVSGGMNLFWDLYSINGNSLGFDGGEPFKFLWGGTSFTGLWFEPALSGWGVSIDYKDNPGGIDTIATAFYYDGTEPVWAQAQFEGTPTGGGLEELTEFTGHGLCPECLGQPTSLVPRLAGAVGLSLDTNLGWVDLTEPSGQFWRRGSPATPVGIFRLTQP